MTNPGLLIRRVLKATPWFSPLRELYRQHINAGEQWSRIVMNRAMREFVKNLRPEQLDVLEISGSRWKELETFNSHREVHYPDFDICRSVLEETFDLVIAEQVFEHVLWPYRAGRNVYAMLRKGGCFLVNTPFLIRVHEQPEDCSRWTETGLKHLLAECGFPLQGISTGSWGNRACMNANLRWWVNYLPHFHSLRNEPSFPVTVWAKAVK